MSSVNHNWIWW